MRALSNFITEYVATEPLIAPGFDHSVRIRHALQDCIYLALAIRQGCALITSDAKFVRMVEAAGLGDHVRLLGRSG